MIIGTSNGSVTINGTNITIRNGQIIVDGKTIESDVSGVVEIKIEGDICNLTTNSPVTVNGNVTGSIKCNGSVQCGNVGGNIDAGGSVQCDDVNGSIDCGGSARCGNVGGDIDAGGSVRYTK